MSAGSPPKMLSGWKEIAAKLRCSVRKAQELMALPLGERPPIYRDHRGICAVEIKLENWMDAQFIELGTYRELQRGRRAAKTAATKRAAETDRSAA